MKRMLRGDSLVEIMIAVGIFGIIAVSAISLMNKGINNAQATLEITMARNEISAQAEALRFLHDAYAEDYKEGTNGYIEMWNKITENAITFEDGASFAQFNSYPSQTTSCEYVNSENPDLNTTGILNGKSFIINTHMLDHAEDNPDGVIEIFQPSNSSNVINSASTYPRLVYSDSEVLGSTNYETTLRSAEGIWVTALKSTGVDAMDRPQYYDFYIRTCWNSPGQNKPITISTTVRLYNPATEVVTNTNKLYSLVYDANAEGVSNIPEPISGLINFLHNNHTFTLSTIEPTRTGYAFLGWAETPDATNATYHPGDEYTTSNTDNVLYAVWQERLYMQVATLSQCGETMYDYRGPTDISYNTARFKGQCWMSQNLDLPGGITLTSEDTNLNSGISSYNLPASTTGGFSNSNQAVVYNTNTTNCNGSTPCYSYYSYPAATAGTNPSSGNAQSDICPRGWRLPTKSELIAYMGNTPFKGIKSGYMNDSSLSGATSSYYWSSTANGSSGAYYSIKGMYTYAGGKNHGMSIRCTLKQPTYVLAYDPNNGTSAPAGQIEVSESSSYTFTISNSKPTRSNYVFMGWATNSTATNPEYQPGDSFTTSSRDNTLYAVWADATM